MLDSRAADLNREERPEVIVSAMMFSPIIHSIVCYKLLVLCLGLV